MMTGHSKRCESTETAVLSTEFPTWPTFSPFCSEKEKKLCNVLALFFWSYTIHFMTFYAHLPAHLSEDDHENMLTSF